MGSRRKAVARIQSLDYLRNVGAGDEYLSLTSNHRPASHHSNGEGSQHDNNGGDGGPPTWQRLQSALDALKAQHTALVRSVHNLTVVESGQGSPLPITTEEEEQADNSGASGYYSNPRNRRSKHTSISTNASDLSREWFDADDGGDDGAQEFIMDVQTTPDGNEQPSRMLTNDSRSSVAESVASSGDTDVEDNKVEEEEEEDDANKKSPRLIRKGTQRQQPPLGSSQVVRRTQLPAPPVGDEGSLFAILKKNVGKVREGPRHVSVADIEACFRISLRLHSQSLSMSP